jgi:hypothetical protein
VLVFIVGRLLIVSKVCIGMVKSIGVRAANGWTP